MKRAIETGLPPLSLPVSWLTVGNGLLSTVHVPLDARGVVVEGGIREQTSQCLRNLELALTAAKTTMDDVTQVVVFLTDLADAPAMNEVYQQHFRPPYPSRATLVVAGLVISGMRVEMLVFAAPSDGKAIRKRAGSRAAPSRRRARTRRRAA